LDRVIVVGRRIDALVLQQSFDNREVAVASSQSHGQVVVARRIEQRRRAAQQKINHIDVAVLCCSHNGDVCACAAVDVKRARPHDLSHKLQSTMRSVIAECAKVEHADIHDFLSLKCLIAHTKFHLL
jgi:hypothetical protein